MSIATYSDLVTAISNWAARDDATFNNRVDEFIDLAEDRIHYGSGEPGDQFYSAPLRISAMETSADLTVDAQTVAVPSGFLEPRRLYLNTDPKQDVDYLPSDRFWAASAVASATSGKPVIYTIEGTNFVFGPSPDSSYTGKLSYFKKLDALDGTNTTNWLITNAPAVYLYAALTEAMIWDGNQEKAQNFFNLFNQRINALVRQDKSFKVGAGLPRMIVDRVA